MVVVNKQKILVTGGFGYVGSRLTPLLLSQGHDVRVLDLMLYSDSGLKFLQAHDDFHQWENRFSLVKKDLRHPDALQEALEDRDTVIHLAAISNDPTGDIDETLTRQVNFDAIGCLLHQASKAGVKRFISASSSSVFGARGEQNITEELEPEPITYYSKYKMLSEWLVLSAASDQFCTTSIRPATICGYSPRQRLDLTVNKLTADAIHKGVITVHGGQQRRPNVGISDMINLYSHLTQLPTERINAKTFNFGFENLKVIEIANVIKDELKDLDVEIKVTETQDLRDYHISSQRILDSLGYKPISSIKREVGELRKALESQEFPDIEDSAYYNMKSMKLDRDAESYVLLSS